MSRTAVRSPCSITLLSEQLDSTCISRCEVSNNVGSASPIAEEATMITSRHRHPVETRRSLTAFAMSLVALMTLAACGGGSDSDESAPATAAAGDSEVAVTDSDTDTDAPAGELTDGDIGEIDGIEDLAGAIGGEELTDAIDALGIDTRMQIIADQLDGTYEVTNDSTAFLYLDGDANTDGLSVCFIVGAISSPGDRVVVAYPNGDVVCD
jgi:hypothetical protein